MLAAAVLLGSLSSAARAGPEQIDALIARLSDPIAKNRRAAARSLQKIGPPAFEPLRQAGEQAEDAEARARIKKLWDRMLDRRAGKLLPARMGSGSKKMSWSLVVRSDLLPYVRVYRGKGQRYPEAVILDLRTGNELSRVRSHEMTSLLRRAALKCRSKKVARAVSVFFIGLHYQPYAARKVRLKVKRRRRGHLITTRLVRTIPWSEGTAAKVGNRTVERQVTIALGRTCAFRLLDDKIVKVIYAAP